MLKLPMDNNIYLQVHVVSQPRTSLITIHYCDINAIIITFKIPANNHLTVQPRRLSTPLQKNITTITYKRNNNETIIERNFAHPKQMTYTTEQPSQKQSFHILRNTQYTHIPVSHQKSCPSVQSSVWILLGLAPQFAKCDSLEQSA